MLKQEHDIETIQKAIDGGSAIRAILGIDAAWTRGAPSGVALIVEKIDGWSCIAVAPSYCEFLAQLKQKRMRNDWEDSLCCGGPPCIPSLLSAVKDFVGIAVDVAAIDMPMARSRISNRRFADDEVSREFGSRKCSTHSPRDIRPGRLGEDISQAFFAAGFSLRTSITLSPVGPALIEVYPHTGLLSLLKRAERVPYKVSKSKRYWRDSEKSERIRLLVDQFRAIYKALELCFGALPFVLPEPSRVGSLTSLKRYEDGLDALVCAWVGMEYLRGRAVALGDEDSAIWCPTDVVR